MNGFVIGSAYVSLFIRGARSLKDRRSLTQGIVQKLKNEGFSVVEDGKNDHFKKSIIAFSYIAKSKAI